MERIGPVLWLNTAAAGRRHAIAYNASYFSSERMVAEYVLLVYVRAAGLRQSRG